MTYPITPIRVTTRAAYRAWYWVVFALLITILSVTLLWALEDVEAADKTGILLARLEASNARVDALEEGFNRCLSQKQEITVQINGETHILQCKSWSLREKK